jgi:hypothetical protein
MIFLLNLYQDDVLIQINIILLFQVVTVPDLDEITFQLIGWSDEIKTPIWRNLNSKVGGF